MHKRNNLKKEGTMSDEKTTLELIAPTLEEAIERGLEQLGVTEDDVDIEELDKGNKGLFGLGNRQARVRLTVKNDVKVSIKNEADKLYDEYFGKKDDTSIEDDDDVNPLEIAKEVVVTLLERMSVRANVETKYIKLEEENDQDMILVDIQGNDLSILIGRRTETLNALQYITSLILGKRLERWVPITIDVQGYRSRREKQLRQLARKMAEQAVSTGRRQVLEPMPANERRLVHLELRDNPQVETQSVGDEPMRKVTIVLR